MILLNNFYDLGLNENRMVFDAEGPAPVEIEAEGSDEEGIIEVDFSGKGNGFLDSIGDALGVDIGAPNALEDWADQWDEATNEGTKNGLARVAVDQMWKELHECPERDNGTIDYNLFKARYNINDAELGIALTGASAGMPEFRADDTPEERAEKMAAIRGKEARVIMELALNFMDKEDVNKYFINKIRNKA